MAKLINVVMYFGAEKVTVGQCHPGQARLLTKAGRASWLDGALLLQQPTPPTSEAAKTKALSLLQGMGGGSLLVQEPLHNTIGSSIGSEALLGRAYEHPTVSRRLRVGKDLPASEVFDDYVPAKGWAEPILDLESLEADLPAFQAELEAEEAAEAAFFASEEGKGLLAAMWEEPLHWSGTPMGEKEVEDDTAFLTSEGGKELRAAVWDEQLHWEAGSAVVWQQSVQYDLARLGFLHPTEHVVQAVIKRAIMGPTKNLDPSWLLKSRLGSTTYQWLVAKALTKVYPRVAIVLPEADLSLLDARFLQERTPDARWAQVTSIKALHELPPMVAGLTLPPHSLWDAAYKYLQQTVGTASVSEDPWAALLALWPSWGAREVTCLEAQAELCEALGGIPEGSTPQDVLRCLRRRKLDRFTLEALDTCPVPLEEVPQAEEECWSYPIQFSLEATQGWVVEKPKAPAPPWPDFSVQIYQCDLPHATEMKVAPAPDQL